MSSLPPQPAAAPAAAPPAAPGAAPPAAAAPKLTVEEAIERLRADPHSALTLDLDDDMLLELRDALNPYGRVVGPAHNEQSMRAVAVCITNQREDYTRRFTVTAMAAFLYRMEREWTAPPEQRRWAPAGPKGPTAPFTADELEAHAGRVAAAAGLLRAAQAEAAAARAAAVEYDRAELVFSEAEMAGALAAAQGTAEGKETAIYQKITRFQELRAAAEEAEGRAQGLLFTATLMVRDGGIDADLRLPATEKAARRHPAAARAIDENPDWHRGLLPAGQLEAPAAVARAVIRGFLNNYLEYDPDAHVRSAYDQVKICVERRDVAGLPDKVLYDPYDPERLPLKVLLQHAAPESAVPGDAPPLRAILHSQCEADRQRDYNTLCRLLQSPHLAAAARYVVAEDPADPDRRERWRRMLLPRIAQDVLAAVPPQDTFHRFKYYCDVNFEGLRAAVESIYHEKPDLEFAVQVMEYFSGAASQVEKDSAAFRDRHQHDVITDIKVIKFGGWTVLGEFEKNRDRIDVYNDQAALLKRILDRHEEDARFGKLLMRQRVYKAKAENIARDGPDAPGLAAYKQEFPGGPEAISPEDRLRLERARGDPRAAKELKYFEEQQEIVKSIEAVSLVRALTPEEAHRLEAAAREMDKAREMMEVPADALQVDVWRVNAKEGSVRRDKIYTRAVAPGGTVEDMDLTARNAARDELIESLVERAREGPAPLDCYPAGSRALAAQAFKEGRSAPPLAPFAQDFLAAEVAAEREASDVQVLGGGPAGGGAAPGPAAAGAPSSVPAALADVVRAAIAAAEAP